MIHIDCCILKKVKIFIDKMKKGLEKQFIRLHTRQLYFSPCVLFVFVGTSSGWQFCEMAFLNSLDLGSWKARLGWWAFLCENFCGETSPPALLELLLKRLLCDNWTTEHQTYVRFYCSSGSRQLSARKLSSWRAVRQAPWVSPVCQETLVRDLDLGYSPGKPVNDSV